MCNESVHVWYVVWEREVIPPTSWSKKELAIHAPGADDLPIDEDEISSQGFACEEFPKTDHCKIYTDSPSRVRVYGVLV